MAKIFSTTPIIGIDFTKVYRRTDIVPIPGPSTVAFGSDGYKYIFAMLVNQLAIGRHYVGIVEGMDHPTPLAFAYERGDEELYNRVGGVGDYVVPTAPMFALSKWQTSKQAAAEEGALPEGILVGAFGPIFEAATGAYPAATRLGVIHAINQRADRYIHAGNAERAAHGAQLIPRFKRVSDNVLLAAGTYAWFRALKI